MPYASARALAKWTLGRPAGSDRVTSLDPRTETAFDSRRLRFQPYAIPILESKLNPLAREYEGVPRLALLDRLQASIGTPVVAVVAAPGYGKTMLLTQWARIDPRPFAWLSIDREDNDPAALVAYLAAALDQAEPMAPDVLAALTSPGASITGDVLPNLQAALAAKDLPTVIVLDNLHLLHDPECLEVVAALARYVPRGSQVAMASRGQPQLSFGALRADHGILEIGGDSLAMSLPEATLLLKDAEVRLSRDDVADLVLRTEGWPVALYLAAMSLKEWGAGEGGPAWFASDDLALGEYVQETLLSRLPPRLVAFLTCTSVLEQMSGPLCDAVLGRTGSARLLESLERANLLVVPVDPGRTWYRYHRQFRKLLLAGLRRDQPGLDRQCALRAAAWCEDNGQPEAAVGYAMAAGDPDHVARLVVKAAVDVHPDGRIAVLRPWFEWFDRRKLIDRYPAVATLGACFNAQLGDAAAAERWMRGAEQATVEHGSSEAPLPDGSPTIQGWLSLVRAMMCRQGMEQMRTDAEVAMALVPVGSPWRATAVVLLGVSHLLAGEHDAADRVFMEADDGGSGPGEAGVTVALAERAVLALARGEWTQAEILAERARLIMRRARLEEDVSSALLHAVSARTAIHRGDLERAREDLARVAGLRSVMTYALPLYAAQTRLEVVRAHIALTDVPAARAELAEVDELLRRRPDLGVIGQETSELKAQLDATRGNAIGATLTGAELRLLHLLGTHHSFREIGDQLFLSRHTVKSHAMSIYRKFGVSSRSEAIEHACDLGLLIR
jgi:LuxR family transcriptional regulator, maltose regulon positive regulatory protein